MGFVCFCTTAYEDEKRWPVLKLTFEEIVQGQLERCDGRHGVENVAQMLQFRIIGDPTLAGTSVAHVAECASFDPLMVAVSPAQGCCGC